MLGDLIGESHGKRTTRQIVSVDNPPKVEVTAEDSGKMLGLDATSIVTYQAQLRPDGNLYGEGRGILTTRDGDVATFKGQGVGRLQPGGAVSYRGACYYSSASPKLARLNSVAAVFEFEVDANGNTHSKFWEWK